MSHEKSHAGGAVSSQLAAGIEPEPSDPEHGRANHGQGHAVGWDRFGTVTPTFTDHDAGDESGDAGVDVDDRPTGKIERGNSPACDEPTAPDHVPHRNVGEGKPEDHENQYSAVFHAFRECAHNQSGRDDSEGHLKSHIDGFRYRSGDGVYVNSLQKELAKTSEEGVTALRNRRGCIRR